MCDCSFQAGLHRPGSGKCPYGINALLPHPDGLPRFGPKANALLNESVRIAANGRVTAPAIVAALHRADDATILKLRRKSANKLREWLQLQFNQ